ncbi:hypothetical protein G9A89_004965 [Geosiphon pyriformis]|nr:hypothetical protein G9A89_004965 [Geosiphon pyriformis]
MFSTSRDFELATSKTGVKEITIKRHLFQSRHVPLNDTCSEPTSLFARATPPLSTKLENPLEGQKGADDYTLNVGRAIHAIRSDLPRFFENGLTDTSIYSQHILLSDPHHTRLYVKVRSENLEQDFGNYIKKNSHIVGDEEKKLSWAANYQVKNISPSDRDTRLYVRWRVEGIPRSSYILSMLSERSTRISRSSFSGVFCYKFDVVGLISEHYVENIVPAPSRRAVLYHGFGGLGGLAWRIRSAMRKQKNEWGISLGIVSAKEEKIKQEIHLQKPSTRTK